METEKVGICKVGSNVGGNIPLEDKVEELTEVVIYGGALEIDQFNEGVDGVTSGPCCSAFVLSADGLDDITR